MTRSSPHTSSKQELHNYKVAGTQKTSQNKPQEPSKRPRAAQEAFKIDPGADLAANTRLRSVPDLPKKRPGEAKKHPKAFKSRPSSAKEPPKRGPDPSKMQVNKLQDEF